tara:strand:- start:260 stop:538 length:279 start_codon:yes stop_codon:yes gene_type:complete
LRPPDTILTIESFSTYLKKNSDTSTVLVLDDACHSGKQKKQAFETLLYRLKQLDKSLATYEALSNFIVFIGIPLISNYAKAYSDHFYDLEQS